MSSTKCNTDQQQVSDRKTLIRKPTTQRRTQSKLGATKIRPSLEINDVPEEQVISRDIVKIANKEAEVEGTSFLFDYGTQSEVLEGDMFAGEVGVDFISLKQQMNEIATDVSNAASNVLFPQDLSLMAKAQQLINRLGQMTVDMATAIDTKVEGFVTNLSSSLQQPALHTSNVTSSSNVKFIAPASKQQLVAERRNSGPLAQIDSEQEWGEMLGNQFMTKENQIPNSQFEIQKSNQSHQQSPKSQLSEKELQQKLSQAEINVSSLQQKYDALLQKLHGEKEKMQQLHQENKLLRSESMDGLEKDHLLSQQVQATLQELISEKAKLASENERLCRENGQLQELLLYSMSYTSATNEQDQFEVEEQELDETETDIDLLTKDWTEVSEEVAGSFGGSGFTSSQDQTNDSNI
eukprot:TRINITY_DN2263_c1_g1_i1.p1 TRINITY_DN2263_c1_g1~~TRINITY_DN2263_c1_g1_i1.p1  ORF type:complete len:428 (+),score=41.81 TRINITY_DN2263_c1_g1_i1:61-1284(+)